MYADGKLELHFPQFQTTETAKAFSNILATKLVEAGLVLPADYLKTWFAFPAEKWTTHADAIIGALKQGLTAPV